MARIRAAVRAVRSADIDSGQNRHRGRQFPSGNGAAYGRGAVYGLGNGARHRYAGRHNGHQQKKLAVHHPVGTGDRRVVVVLLPCAPARRSKPGGADRQAERGTDNGAGICFSRRSAHTENGCRRSFDRGGHTGHRHRMKERGI